MYASGKYAQATCDRCGQVGSYRRMVLEPITNAFVHPRCLDKKVINEPIQVGPDRIALRHARPQEKTTYTIDSTLIRIDSTFMSIDLD